MTSDPSATRWPQIRAAILAIVVGSQLLLALPIGPKVTEKGLKSERGKAEVDVWMSVVGPLGLSRTQFEDLVLWWSATLVDTDKKVTAPIKAVTKHLRTGQSWALFAGTDPTPLVFEVIGFDDAGQQRVLFRRLDPDATWRIGQFDYRRVRGVFDLSKKGMPPRYTNFARWAADHAFADFPELKTVVVRQTEIGVVLPWEPPSDHHDVRYRKVFRRDGLPGDGDEPDDAEAPEDDADDEEGE